MRRQISRPLEDHFNRIFDFRQVVIIPSSREVCRPGAKHFHGSLQVDRNDVRAEYENARLNQVR